MELRKEAERLLEKYRFYRRKENIEGHLNAKEGEFLSHITNVLSNLPAMERTLLFYRYIENDGETYDYMVKNKLGVSERTYYRIKARALLDFYHLANN